MTELGDNLDGEKMTALELVAATALFGWECPSAWKQLSRIARIIATDPFFDLFAMSCIVANTVLLALDHANIDREMAHSLTIGNHVCIYIFILGQAIVHSLCVIPDK